jgi:hypothetical protein
MPSPSTAVPSILPAHPHWYLDWALWSSLFALAAIVLSQLPPLHILFRTRRLDIEVYSRVRVSHQVGNPIISLVISLRNAGGRKLRIRSLRMSVSRDGRQAFNLPGLSFFESATAANSRLFVPFDIKPDETWVHSVMFSSPLERQDEKILRASTSAIRSDIDAKIQLRPEGAPKTAVEAAPNLVEPVEKLFDSSFAWYPGEYVVTLQVEVESIATPRSKKYRFTLYESDTNELRARKDDLKFGDGVYFQSNKHVFLDVPLSRNSDDGL